MLSGISVPLWPFYFLLRLETGHIPELITFYILKSSQEHIWQRTRIQSFSQETRKKNQNHSQCMYYFYLQVAVNQAM